jgi:RimJ/RimL family protein N-acetyltransferase
MKNDDFIAHAKSLTSKIKNISMCRCATRIKRLHQIINYSANQFIANSFNTLTPISGSIWQYVWTVSFFNKPITNKNGEDMKSHYLLNVPKVIHTNRLTLRAHEPGDGVMINMAIRETFPQLKLWMPWAKIMPTVANNEEFARRAAAQFIRREEFTFGIHLHDQANILLGGIGVHNCSWENRSFELGYWCRKSAQGAGYITESADCLTNLLAKRYKAKRVVIRCDSRNNASAAVAKRLDFKLEGCMRQVRKDNACKFFDMLVFAKTF